jgi:glycosyltransferase involved in cell wall biosynthesis
MLASTCHRQTADSPRVLLITEAANPDWVSVPLIGWSLGRALAKLCRAHVVTQVRNLDAFLRRGLCEGVDFTAIDNEAIAGRLYRLALRLRGGSERAWGVARVMSSLAYYEFERRVWRQFGSRLTRGEFDIVHRVTPVSPATPSLLARRCRDIGVPFVLGPINGGLGWPPAFRAEQVRERERLAALRVVHRVFPGYRATRRCASAILVGSRATVADMPGQFRSKCIYVPENAVDVEFLGGPRQRRSGLPLRAVFAGRLVPCKGLTMALDAVRDLVREGRLEFDVVGDGPDRTLLEQHIRGSGIDGGVRMHGSMPRSRVRDMLLRADVLLFPSVRDFGGGVVVEAMAAGAVPIVLDYGGPGEIVTDRTGFRIPLTTRSEIVVRLRQVLVALADDPSRLDGLAFEARRRVAELFTWDVKADQVMQVYDWVLGRSSAPPSFRFLDDDPPGGHHHSTESVA